MVAAGLLAILAALRAWERRRLAEQGAAILAAEPDYPDAVVMRALWSGRGAWGTSGQVGRPVTPVAGLRG